MAESSTSAVKRVALVGAGGLGQPWSKVVLGEPGAKLVAFVDPLIGTPRQSAWLDDVPDVPRFTSLAAMTEQADAILVTTQSPAHAEVIRDGLSAAITSSSKSRSSRAWRTLRRSSRLAASKKLTLMVSQNYRYFPGAKMLRAHRRQRQATARSRPCIAASGAIGPASPISTACAT